jgi:hypothetical protein
METAVEITFHNSVRKIHQKGHTDENNDTSLAKWQTRFIYQQLKATFLWRW